MKQSHSFIHPDCSIKSSLIRHRRRALLSLAGLLLLMVCASLTGLTATAQTRSPKLPSPDKIVGEYLKAIGGKKRVAAIRDATYEWTVRLEERELGQAKWMLKAPASVRTSLLFGNGELGAAANPSSVWGRGLDGRLMTLTGQQAGVARLRALLEASRLVDYKKLNVLARTLSLSQENGEPAYVIEFSTRGGARLNYWFSASTKLLLKMADEMSKTTVAFSDYRAESGVLEPHRVLMNLSGTGALTLVLRRVQFNTGLTDSAFDPPRAAATLDVPALLKEVERNQDALDERVSDYTFTQKVTERQINDRGEVKKETVRVYEVYPLPNRAPVFRLISEDGVPLTAERAAKEERRVTEELVKAERERERDKAKAEERRRKRERARAERAQKTGRTVAEEEDEELAVSQFLRACEFVSPRTERFRERDAVVFDFRPRAGFRPSNRGEEIISKLVGVVWIDPIDKQVMRLEARLAQGFKIAGGLLLSLRPGAAFVIEQTRMADGVWLPRFAQLNLSVKVLLFGGGDVNQTVEWSDYRRFDAEASGYKIESPPTGNTRPAKPNQ